MYNQYGQPMYGNQSFIKPQMNNNPFIQPMNFVNTQKVSPQGIDFRVPPMQTQIPKPMQTGLPQISNTPPPQFYSPPSGGGFNPPPPMRPENPNPMLQTDNSGNPIQFNPVNYVENPNPTGYLGGMMGSPSGDWTGVNDPLQQARWNLMMRMGIPY